MEGFLGVDKDGAPIMAPKLKPRSLMPKRETEEIFNGAPTLVPTVMSERAALTVHEILEAVVTTEPSGPRVPAKKQGQGILRQKEFESNQAVVQQSVATFRLPNPGKPFGYIVPRI